MFEDSFVGYRYARAFLANLSATISFTEDSSSATRKYSTTSRKSATFRAALFKVATTSSAQWRPPGNCTRSVLKPCLLTVHNIHNIYDNNKAKIQVFNVTDNLSQRLNWPCPSMLQNFP